MLYVFRTYAHYPVAPKFRVSATASVQSGNNHADDVRWHKQAAIAKDTQELSQGVSL